MTVQTQHSSNIRTRFEGEGGCRGGSTTEGEIGGPRFEWGEVSNLDMISEYFDPEESATFFMIVEGSRSASLLAVI
jgi:hypothetical protein